MVNVRLKWLGSRRSEDGYITSDGEYSDIEENDDQTWQALAKDKKKFLKVDASFFSSGVMSYSSRQAAHLQIMGDVSDDFSSVRSICQEFQKVGPSPYTTRLSMTCEESRFVQHVPSCINKPSSVPVLRRQWPSL